MCVCLSINMVLNMIKKLKESRKYTEFHKPLFLPTEAINAISTPDSPSPPISIISLHNQIYAAEPLFII